MCVFRGSGRVAEKEVFIGYRWFAVSYGRLESMLSHDGGYYKFKPKGENVASRKPHPQTPFGFYVFKTKTEAMKWNRGWSRTPEAKLFQVVGYGTVVSYRNGFRAEKLKIIGRAE